MKKKMTFQNLVQEFVKAPDRPVDHNLELTQKKSEPMNARQRHLRNIRFLKQQQASMGKSILKDPDYKYKYACKDIQNFKKKRIP